MGSCLLRTQLTSNDANSSGDGFHFLFSFPPASNAEYYFPCDVLFSIRHIVCRLNCTSFLTFLTNLRKWTRSIVDCACTFHFHCLRLIIQIKRPQNAILNQLLIEARSSLHKRKKFTRFKL